MEFHRVHLDCRIHSVCQTTDGKVIKHCWGFLCVVLSLMVGCFTGGPRGIMEDFNS